MDSVNKATPTVKIPLITVNKPLWATPVLRSTGMPEDFPEWSQRKQDNYIASLAFDAPPNYEVEVIDD